jgi:hypothetical protein
MTIVNVEESDVYTIAYQYPQLKAPSFIRGVIDVTIDSGTVSFQCLSQDHGYSPGFPLYERVGTKVYLENGQLLAITLDPSKRLIRVPS